MYIPSRLRLIAMVAVLGIGFVTYDFSTCDAAMVTAYEQQVDEKYVVDTTSIYRPDANHISVLVYYSDTYKNILNSQYNYKFRFQNDKWYLLEKVSPADVVPTDIKEDDTHYWSIVEPKSVAQDVLRVAVAYS